MLHFNSLTSIKIIVSVILLMTTAATNASLLDCSQSLPANVDMADDCALAANSGEVNNTYGVNNVLPAALLPAVADVSGFHVNRVSSSKIPGSAPLIGFVCTLLAVLLIRAKAFNSK